MVACGFFAAADDRERGTLAGVTRMSLSAALRLGGEVFGSCDLDVLLDLTKGKADEEEGEIGGVFVW